MSYEWDIVLGATKQTIIEGKSDSFEGAKRAAIHAANVYAPTPDEHLRIYLNDGTQVFFCEYPKITWEIEE